MTLAEPNSDPSGTPAGGQAGDGAPASPGGDRPDYSRADFLERARREPEWAAEQVRASQAEKDRLTTAFGKLETESQELKTWAGRLGELKQNGFTGDSLRTYVDFLNDLVTQRPDLKTALQGYLQTGELRLGGRPNGDPVNDTGDEYLTEEQKEIRELRSELQAVKGEIGSVGQNSARDSLIRHFETETGKLGITAGPLFDSLRGKTIAVLDSWARQGETGRAAMKGLMTAQGAPTVRNLILGAMSDDELNSVVATRLQRQGKALADLSTGGPSAGPSSGAEPMPEHESALEALQAAKARPELTQRYE